MRNGDRSELFSSEHLNELILKGTNQAWDSLVSGISMDRASFTVLRAGCALRTGHDIDDADLVSAYQRNMLAPTQAKRLNVEKYVEKCPLHLEKDGAIKRVLKGVYRMKAPQVYARRTSTQPDSPSSRAASPALPTPSSASP